MLSSLFLPVLVPWQDDANLPHVIHEVPCDAASSDIEKAIDAMILLVNSPTANDPTHQDLAFSPPVAVYEEIDISSLPPTRPLSLVKTREENPRDTEVAPPSTKLEVTDSDPASADVQYDPFKEDDETIMRRFWDAIVQQVEEECAREEAAEAKEKALARQ
ncbi:hypothetical protein C8Q79DRAFT_969203 [Trametes meyenii]|nr:hypothetical protein C8Q79DRAFT_969203 [Trametes meyenii]